MFPKGWSLPFITPLRRTFYMIQGPYTGKRVTTICLTRKNKIGFFFRKYSEFFEIKFLTIYFVWFYKEK